MRFAPPGAPLAARGAGRAKPQYSVKRAALEELAASDPRARPVVEAVLDYRRLASKLAFSRGYLEHASRSPGGGQRIHACTFQSNTETGRLVMEEPSLQNVPHAICFPFARAPAGAPLARLAPRAAFRPQPGRLLVVADFKQFELRMMAHFGRDDGLVAVLAASDPFTLLAARWCSKPADAVTAAERSWAKAVAYGLLYGKGASSLALEMGIPAREAAALVDAFKASLPGVTAWLADVLADARAAGPPGGPAQPHVRTLLGRRRDLPALAAEGRDSDAPRAAAERQAVNTVCQGSAADVLKLALAALQRHLAADPEQRAQLVLSVHDDAVLEVDAHALAWAAGLLRRVMTDAGAAAGLRVPLAVQLRAGTNWDALSVLG